MLKPSDYSVAWGLILFFVLGNLTGKSDLAQPNPNWDNDYVGRFPSLIPDNLFRFHSNISFMELQQYRQSVSYTNCLWIPHLRSNMNSSWWAIRLQSYLLLQRTDIAEMGSWINIVFHFQCGMLNLSQPQEIFIITLSERGKKFPQWETCTSYQPNYFCHHRNDNKKSGHILQNKLWLWQWFWLPMDRGSLQPMFYSGYDQ